MSKFVKEIKSGIDSKFQDLISDAKDRINDPELDISYICRKLEEGLPNDIEQISQFFLNDLLNYLMDSAKNSLEKESQEKIKKFYGLDMRKKMKKIFHIQKGTTRYSIITGFEFRCNSISNTTGLISSTTSGVIGVYSSAVLKISFLIIFLTFVYNFILKIIYRRRRKKLIEKVENHFIYAKKKVIEALEEVEELFMDDFEKLKTSSIEEEIGK